MSNLIRRAQDDAARKLIEGVLLETHSHLAQAAERLGVSRQHLRIVCLRLGISYQGRSKRK